MDSAQTDYTSNCWRHLQAPQMVPADAHSSERYNSFITLYEPKSELAGITVRRQTVNALYFKVL